MYYDLLIIFELILPPKPDGKNMRRNYILDIFLKTLLRKQKI